MKPAPAPAPAPKAKAPSTGLIGDQGTDSATGIKANADNVKEYVKNVPKMHKGGVVQEDGLKNLKKGEVVIPEEKAEEGKKIMALKDKAGKGIMAQAKEEEDNEPKKEEKHESKKAEKKESKKDEKKDAKKSVKKVKACMFTKSMDGLHVKHDTEPAEAGSNSARSNPKSTSCLIWARSKITCLSIWEMREQKSHRRSARRTSSPCTSLIKAPRMIRIGSF